MKGKKVGLVAVMAIIPAIMLGSCSLRPWGEHNEMQGTVITEPMAEQTATGPTVEPPIEPDGQGQEPNASQGQQTEKGPQEKRTVQVIEEEGVRETPAFAAFLDKETTAFDREEGKERYIYEYYADSYNTIHKVHYMAEDLNQDEKDELLMFIVWPGDAGDLLVFEETGDGSLTAWERWSFITGDRAPDLYYCGDGLFMIDGVVGTTVARYTQEGTPEVLMGYYTKLEDTNDDYYVLSIELWLCEDGKTVKEMSYERYIETWTQEDVVERESEEAREGEGLVNKFLATLGEKKEVSLNGEEHKDKVKTILLEDLLSPKVAAE